MEENGVREKIPPMLYELGVDLVLQGHDHIYARTKPIQNGNAVEADKVTEKYNGMDVEYSVNRDGTIYVIPSTAGPKVYYKNKKMIHHTMIYLKSRMNIVLLNMEQMTVTILALREVKCKTLLNSM
jgi:hypothetical protein